VKALCEDTKRRLRANIENLWGITALQIATEMKHDEIVKTLLERPEVAKQVERLYRDRQVHVHAANAILDCKCDFCQMVTTTFGIFCVLWECKH
jgi:ankyrin repeat protein